MNSDNRIAATLYSLGTLACLRNMSINTPHKGDDDDDNNNNSIITIIIIINCNWVVTQW